MVTPLEGSVVYLNYYIDLENNETLNVKDVLSKLNIKMNDFNTKCVGCTLDYLDFMVRLMPIGNLIYVENIELPSSFE